MNNNYSKTLSRRIIYASLSQTVISFWGFAPQIQIPTGAPSLDPTGDLHLQTPNLLTPGKNPAGAYVVTVVCRTILEKGNQFQRWLK